MTNRWLLSLTLFFSVVAFTVMMRTRAQPVFGSEYILEDVSLLLSLAYGLVRPRFRRLIWFSISCLMSTTIALMAWKAKSHEFYEARRDVLLTGLFALIAILSAIRAVVEFSKLLKPQQNLD